MILTSFSVFVSALCIIVLPFTLVSVFSSKWIFNDAWCHIEGFILTVCIVSTQFSLAIIAIDRNYAIINSLRYPYVFTQKRGHIVIGISWAISVAISIPPLAGFGIHKYSEDQNTCLIDWQYSRAYSITFLHVGFLIPLVIQSWCYLTIFKAAMNHTKRNNRVFPSMIATTTMGDPPSNNSTSSEIVNHGNFVRYKNMECKAMRTILFIACSYAICWVPYLVCAMKEILGQSISYNLSSFTVIMVFLNTSIDPLIYAFMNRIMRFEIYKFYCDSLNKLSGNTSTHNDSEDYISSTIISTSQSTSRGKGNSMKSRGGKTGLPGRHIEMNTIEEERESMGVIHEEISKGVGKQEIILTPVELHTNKDIIKTLSPNKLKTCAEVHSKVETSVPSSSKPVQKTRRSRSATWSARDKFLHPDDESFLFFDMVGKYKDNKKGNGLKEDNISKESSEKDENNKPTKTVFEQMTLTSSTFIHNDSDVNIHDLDIITELSIDIRQRDTAHMKRQSEKVPNQVRKCLSA